MREEIYNINGMTIVRVNKTNALKEYLAGGKVFAAMVNANLYSPWIQPSNIIQEDGRRTEKGFINFINQLLYYNACHELGYRAKYFIIEK